MVSCDAMRYDILLAVILGYTPKVQRAYAYMINKSKLVILLAEIQKLHYIVTGAPTWWDIQDSGEQTVSGRPLRDYFFVAVTVTVTVKY